MSIASIPHAPEIHLLKLAAAGQRQQLASRLLSLQVDTNELVDFLENQQLGIYFVAMLDAMRLTRLLPARLRQRLEWQREAQHQRRQLLIGALAQIQGEFASDGVTMLLTKGLHLAEAFWGGTENRFTWDLDLLVERRQLDRAIGILRRAGYRSSHRRTLAPLLARHFSHAMEFTRGDVSVDLHWIFRPRPGYKLDYTAIIQRRRMWKFGETQYAVLHHQDALLMLLLGIAEDIERAQPNYRKLWDIYLMLRSSAVVNWNAFLLHAERQGVGRLVVAMLALTCHALDCSAEFTDLQQTLAEWSAGMDCSPQQLQAIIVRPPGHIANRLWIARLQPVPAARYLAWWTLTAPIRYLVWR